MSFIGEHFDFGAEALMNIAYRATCGDPAEHRFGHLGGRPSRQDLDGLSSQDIWTAAHEQDLGFFSNLVLAPSQMPTLAIRVWKRKDGGGRRPIDEPSFQSLLVSLGIKNLIEDALDTKLYQGQVSARARGGRPVFCGRLSATDVDHAAARARDLIFGGKQWVVILDLEDAFGNVPLHLANRGLRGIGLNHRARRRVLSLVKVNAVDRRTRRRYRPRHVAGVGPVGLSQGNPLSPMLFNVALAPLLHHLEATGIPSTAYLDDILLFASSRCEAEGAFREFEGYAQRVGLQGVRPSGGGAKASRIVDAFAEPVPVLRTYLVSKRGVRLTTDKARSATELLKGRVTSHNHARRLLGYQALSRRALVEVLRAS